MADLHQLRATVAPGQRLNHTIPATVYKGRRVTMVQAVTSEGATMAPVASSVFVQAGAKRFPAVGGDRFQANREVVNLAPGVGAELGPLVVKSENVAPYPVQVALLVFVE